MHTLYTDPAGVIDLIYLAAAFAVDGDGADDGAYFILGLLSIGEHVEHARLSYRDRATRDAALVSLGVQAVAMATDPAARDVGDDETE